MEDKDIKKEEEDSINIININEETKKINNENKKEIYY